MAHLPVTDVEFEDQLFYSPESLNTDVSASWYLQPPDDTWHVDSAAPHLEFACQWTSGQLVCGANVPAYHKSASTHFRKVHGISGDDKAWTQCMWTGCSASMQRGSLIRHILSVHLSILRWTCPTCGKSYARRDSKHHCPNEEPLGGPSSSSTTYQIPHH